MMQLECPNCGPRNVSEFRFRGEYVERPRDGADPAQRRAWAEYLYFRDNRAGVQKEWWYHRAGCGRWFLADRDTKSHAVEDTRYWGGEPTP